MPVGYLSTPIGWLKITTTQRLVTGVEQVAEPGASTPNCIVSQAIAQLSEYFAGTRQTFSVPCRYPGGTPFQIRVWDAVGQIPYGQTLSYGALARRIGAPGAARAVGTAVGSNPLLIFVPCHRVVGASSLGGFRLGLPCKQTLLHLEGVL